MLSSVTLNCQTTIIVMNSKNTTIKNNVKTLSGRTAKNMNKHIIKFAGFYQPGVANTPSRILDIFKLGGCRGYLL